jgi:cardiolipin synthase
MRLEFRDQNRIELLCRGEQYFPRLLAAIEAAREEVLLETYIYEDDPTGRAVTAALCAAARRGVQVYVIVDGIGARNFSAAFQKQFAESGVRFLVFRPLRFAISLRMPQLRRLHRKVAVIDAQTAFVGGINIIDDLTSHAEQPLPARLDYAVQVNGPLVADITASSRRLWIYASRKWLKQEWRHWPGQVDPPPPAGTVRAALAVRDNFRRRHLIESAHLAAIFGARNEIILAHAYFWPGRRLLRALYRAAARGVKVRILLQGQPDHPLLYFATQFLYDRMHKSGIELYEYRKSHLHAKVAVIDGHWATVGSSNIDPFSLLLAREANVVIEDAGFCAQLRKSLAEETADGGVLLAKDARHSWWEHVKIRASYEIVRLIASAVGFRA